jgi:hypothetical protein
LHISVAILRLKDLDASRERHTPEPFDFPLVNYLPVAPRARPPVPFLGTWGLLFRCRGSYGLNL